MSSVTETMKKVAYGDHAYLINVPTGEDVVSFAYRLGEVLPSGVTVRAGLLSVVVCFDAPAAGLKDILDAALENMAATLNKATTPTVFTFETVYDGEDLEAVANKLTVNVTELITAHTKIEWNVALVGFAPGFPYLKPVNPDSAEAQLLAQVERLASPRTKVPAGSVAIAAGMSSVYPREMPGGWQLLGRTSRVLFNAQNVVSPSLLKIGDRVKFVKVENI